jgi:uncharacterized hydrophobic protein (TIGR00271 family)
MPSISETETKGNVGLGNLRQTLARRFSLLSDKAEDAEIERRIREGAELVGATPWILVFAIFVASVGLNVNSTAVIIGAMLISPLMGPIMGAGLGVAVYDFDLVKRSLLNLGIATLISLLVSTLYFLVSPLHEAQSELLARTTPTIWDVLIALFGGLAGIVGATRKEKSNVIPGVAIATALMPPVCTAGFGLATGQWSFVGGALYLYTINCVFIALATIAGIRLLKLKRHGFANERIERHVKLLLLILVLATTVPSTYLAINLVNEEVFKAKVNQFVKREFSFELTQVAELKIDVKAKKVEVALIGAALSPTLMQGIETRLSSSGLEGTKIIVRQSGENKVDVAALKSTLLTELYQNSQDALRKKEEQLQNLQSELIAKNAFNLHAQDIAAELRAQYPAAEAIFVSEGLEFTTGVDRKSLYQLGIRSRVRLSKADQQRIENWFKARTKTDEVLVGFEVINSKKSSAKT